jgi:hypothetical protein
MISGSIKRSFVPYRSICGRATGLRIAIALLGLTLGIESASAGMSAENVVVVVNAGSHDSRTIANHYVDLRNIPSGNVVFLREVPSELTISLDQFKSRILLPLLSELNRRQLVSQARVIAYSAGFPTSVDISAHTARLTDPNQKKYQLSTASLTGLTFYYQFLLADNEKYLDWGSNLYARGPFERHFANPYLRPEPRERFDEAIAARDAGDFETAARIFRELFEQSRTIAPLGILAAEAQAKMANMVEAEALLEQSIESGWPSRTYLEQSELLSPLLQSPTVAKLVKTLPNYPAVVQEPVDFHSKVGWTASGWPAESLQSGVPYLLSCMLSVVHPRGSSLEQATQVLQNAAKSDATFPEASFWFTYTRDARTEPRFPQLGNALLWLKKAGHDAEIIHSAMPVSKSGPCVGLMLGTADMPLGDRRWHFVPGAIAENLTSLSARFDTASQTKITELLHAGAAMTCGPVFEPYNLPFKFPSPIMYGYYGSGVSAIEAYYLSVTCPYQLLIVGDPLAQPYANTPTDWMGIKVDRSDSDQHRVEFLRQSLSLGKQAAETALIEIYWEGKLVRVTPAAKRIEMGLPQDVAGSLEVRTVLIAGGPIRPRVSHAEWLSIGDDSLVPVVEANSEAQTIAIRCGGATQIDLMHHGELVHSVQGEGAEFSLDRQALGDGPLRLRPVAVVEGRRISGRAIRVSDGG